MFKVPLVSFALAATLLTGYAAKADVAFDPALGAPGHWNVDETIDQLTINIQGFSFVAGVLGTYYMNEEPPFTTFGSDSITVSNTGANGWGVITLLSEDMPRASTTCNDVPDESVSPYCILDLPLANSNGLDLGVTIFSPAGDTSDPNFSDSIDIVVPEPATIALLGLGLAGVGLVRRRRG